MLFNSIPYVFYLIFVVLFYYKVPVRFRNLFLLCMSCFFYMCFVPYYILILFLLIYIDFSAAIKISLSKTDFEKKKYLFLSVLCTVFILVVFKYFITTITSFSVYITNTEISEFVKNIALPIGLSFHTFQSLSYVMEVYYGRQKVECNFIDYSLFVMFFPQLVAGPIERPQNLLRQLKGFPDFDYTRVASGLRLIAWGLFKKVAIADNLAQLVDAAYSDYQNQSGLFLILATIFFSFQIYCDFSGYTDIAIGSARLLGFDLMMNFNAPYFSKSISEFWRRWHISLSSWFRDYLYIPLGGSRGTHFRTYLNIFITFIVSGCWHGSTINFVVWGALHGFYLVFSQISVNLRKQLAMHFRIDYYPKFKNILNVTLTFFLVSFAWIFFRSKSIGQAKYIVSHLFSFNVNTVLIFFSDLMTKHGVDIGRTRFYLVYFLNSIFMIFILIFIDQLNQGRFNLVKKMFHNNSVLRWVSYFIFVALYFHFCNYSSSEFIYFQF